MRAEIPLIKENAVYHQSFFVIARPECGNETPGPRFLQLGPGEPASWILDPLKALQWADAEEATDFLEVEGQFVFNLDDTCAVYRLDLTVSMVPGE